MIHETMSPETREVSLDAAEIKLGGGVPRAAIFVAIAGVAALGASVLLADWGRFLRAYLTSFAFMLSISLGGLFFVIVQHLTRSGWSVAVRRLAEVAAATVLPLAVLFIPVILGTSALFGWAGEGGERFSDSKRAWLDPTFFTIRAGVYFGIWILLSRFYLRNSVRQDETGDHTLTTKMERFSGPAALIFGLTVTLASFDFLMSLDPHWYSTIYGVYYFSGAAVAIFAFLILAVVALQRAGKLTRAVTVEHYHDLGKQLFGWVIFWAYIAFSQYMLIWYANIPEETQWYLLRQTGAWETVSYALLAGHFVLPFLLLLPRAAKRNPKVLAGMAVWLLAMHYVDLFYLTAPTGMHVEGGHGAGGLEGGGVHLEFGIPEVLAFAGLLALFTAGFVVRLGSVALMAKRDPRLPESLAFENH